MNSVIQMFRKSSRIVAVSSLAALLSASMPLAAFSQDNGAQQEGVIAASKRQQQPQQQPKPPETPPGQKKPQPTQDPQRDRQRQEEQGEVRRDRPSEAERRDLTAPAPATTTPLPGQAAGQQTQNPITQPLALSPDVTTQRVGVNPDQTAMMTLQDAITLALQNNLDIEVSRQSVQAAQFNLYAARGVYDIVSTSDVRYGSQTFPVASIFAGGGESSAVTQKTLTYNFTTGQEISRTGGNWLVEFDNSRRTTSATSSTLTTQYNPIIRFTFTQPLLRNFGIDQNRRTVQILQRALDLSDSEFRQRVIEIISSVQRAYWDLVFAIRNEQIARDSVELTRVQLENNRRMVEAGTLAPIELRSTEAALESRKESVIIALQNITIAENNLKGLLLKEPGDQLWGSAIRPTDEPQLQPTSFSLDEASSLALRNRPELEQLRLEAQQKDVDIKFYKNQLKPQVDLIANYGTQGLAGTPNPNLGLGNPGGFDEVTQGLINNLNLALSDLGRNTFDPIPPPATPGVSVPDRFNGGYFQSLRGLISQDFRTWEAGVRFSFPWRNRTAEGNYGRALAESRQIDARQRQLVQNVQIEVRNALQAVEATRQRFEAAQANRIAAHAQYQGELERFRAGLSTNFFVLERQNDLATARGNELRALTDYNKALADLQRVTGMTLVNNNVQVPQATVQIR